MGSARTNFEEREKKERQVRRAKKKGIEGQKTKPPTPTRVFDAPIRDEEQSRRKKRSGTPTQLLWTIRPPTTRRNHTVNLFF